MPSSIRSSWRSSELVEQPRSLRIIIMLSELSPQSTPAKSIACVRSADSSRIYERASEAKQMRSAHGSPVIPIEL
jgi:hypothetical protein